MLFLIFSFFNVSALLFLFNYEFLPITFLVVYVGAIAVLFLFVLMMLNIKIAELNVTHYNVVPIGLFFSIFFFFQLTLLTRFNFDILSIINNHSITLLLDYSSIQLLKTSFLNLNFLFTNIKALAFVIFSEFLPHFIVASLVLLLAMVSAIVLCLQKQFLNKTQNVYNQVLKNCDFSIKSLL